MLGVQVVLLSGFRSGWGVYAAESEPFARDTRILGQTWRLQAELDTRYQRGTWSAGAELVRREQLTSSIIFRLGLPLRLEASLLVPYQLVNDEYSEYERVRENRQSMGWSDLAYSIKWHMLTERIYRPDVILAYSGRYCQVERAKQDPPLGSGYPESVWSLALVKASDPVIFYSNMSYVSKQADAGYRSGYIPGKALRYNIGSGVLFNDHVTWGISIQGDYTFAGKLDGASLARQHSMLLQTSWSVLLAKEGFLEPSIGFGITPEAPDFVLGLAFPLW